MSRLPRLASCLLVVVVVIVVAVGACNRESSPTVESGPTTSGPIAGTRFEVTGTLTALTADAAVTEPLPTPFTITVAERGVGGAEISGATQNGRPVQINWSAGQPLPVSGSGGGLALNAAAVRVTDKTITWSLDGAARDFLPATYRLGSSVAVGERGLARPVDSTTFTAGDDTSLSTRGGATIALPPRSMRIEGREGSLTLEGRLTLGTETGDRPVAKVRFGPGAYEVTLTPVAGGYKLLARLEGRVVA